MQNHTAETLGRIGMSQKEKTESMVSSSYVSQCEGSYDKDSYKSLKTSIVLLNMNEEIQAQKHFRGRGQREAF